MVLWCRSETLGRKQTFLRKQVGQCRTGVRVVVRSRTSNLCGAICIVALPSFTMQSLPGFFSRIAGSSFRDFNGLVQNFSNISPSTHSLRERLSDSASTLLRDKN